MDGLPVQKIMVQISESKRVHSLNALRITEQLAIFEVQVFWDHSDAAPIGNFTSCCTKEDSPGGQYIR